MPTGHRLHALQSFLSVFYILLNIAFSMPTSISSFCLIVHYSIFDYKTQIERFPEVYLNFFCIIRALIHHVFFLETP